MSAFMTNSDMTGFSISVHAMKSMLATIGAVTLSELALKLETASKKKEYDYCVLYFPELKEKLLSLHERLSVIIPDVKNVFAKKPGDPACLKENVQKALSAANDFDCDTGMEAVNVLLVYDFGNDTNTLLQNALTAFRNFDFDGAVESLKAIKN
jgi:HPt (histidine-containing phosphotransfer) domain-containing protein